MRGAKTTSGDNVISREALRLKCQSIIDAHENLRRELHEQLFELNFATFERLILDLLRRSGYSNVQLADRMYKRGRTRQGGLDLKAYSDTDIVSSLTVAQVKQYTRDVPRRFVDELRGTMLRVGAKQGLLITTSRFSKVAQHAAAAITLLPITLIDGDELLDLLIARGIGIKPQREIHLVVDYEFFNALRESTEHKT